MLTLDEPDKTIPVSAMILEGTLHFVGRERVRVAGKEWPADKFEFKVPMYPAFTIWTSPQGLLLDFTEEDNRNRVTERGMKLVRYRQFLEY